MEKRCIVQVNDWPADLERLVVSCQYREGWRFRLTPNYDRGQGSSGTTLEILIECKDTYNPEQDIRIRHLFIVPAASYNERSWRRWLFDRILDVEKHEAMEFFQIDGRRPYAPNHGPGHDPYIIFEEGTLQEKRTSYLGVERSGDDPASEKIETDAEYRKRIIMVAKGSEDHHDALIATGTNLDRLGDKYELKRYGVE